MNDTAHGITPSPPGDRLEAGPRLPGPARGGLQAAFLAQAAADVYLTADLESDGVEGRLVLLGGSVMGAGGPVTLLPLAGTNDLRDMMRIGRAWPKRDEVLDFAVHGGVFDQAARFYWNHQDLLHAAARAGNLVLVGHSLGGAHALPLAALLARARWPAALVVTFGAPPVARVGIRRHLARAGTRVVQFANHRDWAPRACPMGLLGYVHAARPKILQGPDRPRDAHGRNAYVASAAQYTTALL